MAGRMCKEMLAAIKLFKTGRYTVRKAAEEAGVTWRGLYYALTREGLI